MDSNKKTDNSDKQTITPWTVKAESADGKMATIDYDHVISQFGCQKFNSSHVEAFERLAGDRAHRFLRRNLVFAHRDFDVVLSSLERGEKFYLYTGRGPSSRSMHIGHSVPFLLCKYLQKTFNVPIVIQITDDEKFLCKNISLEESRRYAAENIKDIIAYGFDSNLTYIFSNYESAHLFEENTLKIAKNITLNDAFKVFGFNMSTSIGMAGFPARQIAASFSSSFGFLKNGMQCLIPCAVDQDPYFRLARDISGKIGEKKPASLYVSLLPDLQGTDKKMSASDLKSAIYLDDAPETIKSKINKLAFSGGQETLEMHREVGGRTEVDVPFQYLRYFLEDDDELQALHDGYENGRVTSGEMKKKCIEVVQGFVREYQERREKVTSEMVEAFMDISKFQH